jgi:colanic acid biosynthesis glycosyl transferase WcaI
VPSKVYGIAAAGRPIMAITAKDGEIARLVDRYDCGSVVEPGNGQGLAEALRNMIDDAEQVTRWGRNARAMLDAHFTRRHAFERWEHLLTTIG